MNPRCHSVTPEMIEAGAAEILSEVGGAPLAVFLILASWQFRCIGQWTVRNPSVPE